MLATQSFLKDNFIPAFNMEYLVIAGGAGVGSGYAGGGAGGYRTNFGTEMSGGGNSGGEADFEVISGVALSIIVGAGSAGADGTKTDGSPSTFSTISCVGGGASGHTIGNSVTAKGNDGGSGGGTYGTPTGVTTGGAGTANQGFAGGFGADGWVTFTAGGGGGGAAAIGTTGTGTNPGDGGAGLDSLITGSSVGRGGGGCAFVSNYLNISGTGSHGAAATNGGNGAANTGAGGGPQATTAVYGNGGSGVVILRIPDTRTATFTGGVTGTTADTSVSGYKIYTITATSDTSQTVTFS
jgi:hypothetical protein